MTPRPIRADTAAAMRSLTITRRTTLRRSGLTSSARMKRRKCPGTRLVWVPGCRDGSRCSRCWRVSGACGVRGGIRSTWPTRMVSGSLNPFQPRDLGPATGVAQQPQRDDRERVARTDGVGHALASPRCRPCIPPATRGRPCGRKSSVHATRPGVAIAVVAADHTAWNIPTSLHALDPFVPSEVAGADRGVAGEPDTERSPSNRSRGDGPRSDHPAPGAVLHGRYVLQ